MARDSRWASPRLRGWTLSNQTLTSAGPGFPAPAGMDPYHSMVSGPTVGLPRACGDGPRPSKTAPQSSPASPRLRGWTLAGKSMAWWAEGFPAPAGMDPPQTGSNRGSQRLPRACGDGPPSGLESDPTYEASPRLRGWTLVRTARQLVRTGFPAPAGMDPAPASWSYPVVGLPRACGDGPPSPRPSGKNAPASPRLRGWTRSAERIGAGIAGFPAPAGMDPVATPSPLERRWLPRACGDGPVMRAEKVYATSASPRLRGWTPVQPDARQRAPGFPAPAGMDPGMRKFDAVCFGLPRACGDGPRGRYTSQPLRPASPRLRGWTSEGRPRRGGDSGFPAPAGMDPDRAPCGDAGRWLPRACGDGPESPSTSAIRTRASPRLRGWTQREIARRMGERGFPAPAGMDRGSARGPRRAPRLPRACGDGPSFGAPPTLLVAASPRLRGWTRLPPARPRAAPGFPAPAGMDPPATRGASLHQRLPRACGDGPASIRSS